MRSAKSLAVAVPGVLLLVLSIVAPASAKESGKLGINSWDLYNGKVVLTLGQHVRMWECWKEDEGESPEMLQWVNNRWQFLAKSTGTHYSKHCPKNAPYLAQYRFRVTNLGTWSSKKGYYRLKVRTQCSTCVTYDWYIPVSK